MYKKYAESDQNQSNYAEDVRKEGKMVTMMKKRFLICAICIIDSKKTILYWSNISKILMKVVRSNGTMIM